MFSCDGSHAVRIAEVVGGGATVVVATVVGETVVEGAAVVVGAAVVPAVVAGIVVVGAVVAGSAVVVVALDVVDELGGGAAVVEPPHAVRARPAAPANRTARIRRTSKASSQRVKESRSQPDRV
jgi:hypothetical protein